MENTTCCHSIENATDNTLFSPALNIIGIVIAFWVFISHGVIVLCFIINRNKPWTHYAKQIVSLSLDDVILGTACLLLLIGFTFPYHVVACSFMFYFFFTASLYHVLGICIYRAMTLMRDTQNITVPVSFKVSIGLIMSAWIMAICICAIPFILWAERKNYTTMCQIDAVFGEKMRRAMALLAVAYLVPMVFTNILYLVLCCKLLAVWKKVFPANELFATQASSTNNTMESRHSNRSGIKTQRTALGTIGLLLFLFDVFTLPLVLAMWREHVGVTVSRDIRLVTSLLFAMNSALNPFVYALRIKCLRTALRELLKDCAFIFCIKCYE